jgi:hypothetical protein
LAYVPLWIRFLFAEEKNVAFGPVEAANSVVQKRSSDRRAALPSRRGMSPNASRSSLISGEPPHRAEVADPTAAGHRIPHHRHLLVVGQDLPVQNVAEEQLEVGGGHRLLEVQGGAAVAVDDPRVQLRGLHQPLLVLVVRGGALPAGGSRQAATLARVDGVGGRLLCAPVGHVGEYVKDVSCHRRMSP